MLRRNPYPVYDVMRGVAPVFRDPVHDLWMLFDFESVKRALHDHGTFSSRAAPPGGQPLAKSIEHRFRGGRAPA